MIALNGGTSDDSANGADTNDSNFKLFTPKLIDAVFSCPKNAVLVAISPFLLLVVSAISLDIAIFLFSSQPASFELTNTITVLTRWDIWAFTIWILLDFLTVVRWRSRTPIMFNWLQESGVLRAQSGNIKKEYLEFYNNYRQELRSHKGRFKIFVFVLAFWVVAIIASGLVFGLKEGLTPYMESCGRGLDECLMNLGTLIIVFVFFASLLPLIYCSSSTAWTSYVIGKYIRRLTERFDVVMLPRHPDRCGGLKPLGDYFFDMTLPIIVFMLIFASIGFVGTLQGQPEKEITMLAYSVIFVLGIPILTVTFLLPLLKVHHYMAQSRREAEDNYAIKVSQLEQDIYESINRSGELAKAKSAKEVLELIQVLHPDKAGYPTWPFRLRVIAKVYSPQILALVGVIISIVELILNQ